MTTEEIRVRDTQMCEQYIREKSDGLTLAALGIQHGLSRERIKQILNKAGIKTDRKVERSMRDQFLGVDLTEEVKNALRTEAARRGLSMSALTSDVVREMLIASGHAILTPPEEKMVPETTDEKRTA